MQKSRRRSAPRPKRWRIELLEPDNACVDYWHLGTDQHRVTYWVTRSLAGPLKRQACRSAGGGKGRRFVVRDIVDVEWNQMVRLCSLGGMSNEPKTPAETTSNTEKDPSEW